jgi:hypothetical protein
MDVSGVMSLEAKPETKGFIKEGKAHQEDHVA